MVYILQNPEITTINNLKFYLQKKKKKKKSKQSPCKPEWLIYRLILVSFTDFEAILKDT